MSSLFATSRNKAQYRIREQIVSAYEKNFFLDRKFCFFFWVEEQFFPAPKSLEEATNSANEYLANKKVARTNKFYFRFPSEKLKHFE